MMSMDAWQGREADKVLLDRCRRAIRRAVPDADVILYGSRARGDATEHSDYDILVLVDQPVNVALKDRILSSIYPLELETEAMLTVVTYNRRQWESTPYCDMPFHRNVERDGVIV
ncbi:MAG TPA: nucleotidyltransferase domain-containing protein [Sedimentisphaerales bacterium]|nr:nucleotidyltransferase domain-containing protein [Sedimentisphaerales bacterium]